MVFLKIDPEPDGLRLNQRLPCSSARHELLRLKPLWGVNHFDCMGSSLVGRILSDPRTRSVPKVSFTLYFFARAKLSTSFRRSAAQYSVTRLAPARRS